MVKNISSAILGAGIISSSSLGCDSEWPGGYLKTYHEYNEYYFLKSEYVAHGIILKTFEKSSALFEVKEWIKRGEMNHKRYYISGFNLVCEPRLPYDYQEVILFFSHENEINKGENINKDFEIEEAKENIYPLVFPLNVNRVVPGVIPIWNFNFVPDLIPEYNKNKGKDLNESIDHLKRLSNSFDVDSRQKK